MAYQEPGNPRKNIIPQWDDNSSTRRDRGGCLTLWLSVSIILSIFAIVGILGVFGEVSRSSLAVQSRAQAGVTLLGLLIVGGLICLFGMLNWKRWGVYGIAATSIISPFIEAMFFRATLTDFVAPFVQIGLLFWLVKDKWEHFE
jgi:uncharacterized integral membrane protein